MEFLSVDCYSPMVREPVPGAQAEVVYWQNIKAAQREDEEHLCRPDADAMHLSQRANHFVIG